MGEQAALSLARTPYRSLDFTTQTSKQIPSHTHTLTAYVNLTPDRPTDTNLQIPQVSLVLVGSKCFIDIYST